MRKLTSKKTAAKIATPLSAFAAMIALGIPGANAQPLFDYSFPSSWSGTGTTVYDESGSGVNGFLSGSGATLATYAPGVAPAGTPPGSGSMALSGKTGIKYGNTAALNNTAVAGAGGFTFDISFEWNGGTTYTTQKLIDYAGTESLQLVNLVGNTSASLQMQYANDTGAETVANTYSIVPNVWYNVQLTFNSSGNSVDSSGDISGISSLYINGNLISSTAATKGTYGDTLNRPIGVGEFGYGHTTSILGLNGNIYNAEVDLGVSPVPEPTTTALVGVFGGLAAAWKLRRRKV